MPLIVSGPYADSIARASGSDMMASPPASPPQTLEHVRRAPWAHVFPKDRENPDSLTHDVVAVGDSAAALHSLMCLMADPSQDMVWTHVFESPWVCTAHCDLLDDLARDITAVRLAGFFVPVVAVGGTWGSSAKVAAKLRTRQRRALRDFGDAYGVRVLRLKGKRGDQPCDLRDHIDFDQVSNDSVSRDGDDWTWRLTIPLAHRHVTACGQSAERAVFAMQDSAVFRPLPPVLQRCGARHAHVDASGITMSFAPNLDVWPRDE